MTAQLQPTLENELVRIRPLRADDFEALYAIASDPLLWEQHWAHDRYRREVYAQSFAENLASGGALVVIDRETDRIIGHSRYQPVEGQPDAVEIGWTFLDRSYWGGRYNASFKGLMIDHAHTFAEHVVFYVAGGNRRSERAVEKLGGRRLRESDPLARLRKQAPNYSSYIL